MKNILAHIADFMNQYCQWVSINGTRVKLVSPFPIANEDGQKAATILIDATNKGIPGGIIARDLFLYLVQKGYIISSVQFHPCLRHWLIKIQTQK